MRTCASLICLVLALCCSVGAIKIAMISNGDFSDLGWTYTATSGLRQMEKILKIHNSLVVPDVTTTDQAMTVIMNLVNQEYNLIISVSGVHSNAIYAIAPNHPTTYFVVSNAVPPSNLTNVASIQWTGWEMNYILGFMSALMSKTMKIGSVTQGLSMRGAIPVNSFFIGAQAANPAVEFYNVMIDTYLDPDRAAGAANILLTHGIDSLSQVQDDLTVPLIAMENGMLAHGTTGISLAQLFGENVATSVVRNWTSAFVTLVTMVQTNTWTQVVIPGGFRTGMFVLDAFSYQIPAEIQQRVLDEVQKISNGSATIFCGDYATYLGTPGANGCLSTTNIYKISKILPGVHQLGTYVVPLTQVPFPDSFVIGFAVVTGILLGLTLLAGVAVVALRDDQHIWSSSPRFLVVILIGAMLNYVSVLLRLPTPTEGLCHGTIWTVVLGYSIMFSPLIAKNFRIWRIFDNPKLEDRRVTNSTLFAMSAVAWAGCILLLGIWSGIGGVGIDETPGEDGLGKYEYRTICTQNWDGDSVWIAILAFKGFILAIGCFISYKIRIVEDELFNESKSIALSIYNITFCMCVTIPIVLAIPDTVPKITLFCVAVLFSTTSTLAILFVPKFWGIIMNGYNIHPILTAKQSSVGTSRTSHHSASHANSSSKAQP